MEKAPKKTRVKRASLGGEEKQAGQQIITEPVPIPVAIEIPVSEPLVAPQAEAAEENPVPKKCKRKSERPWFLMNLILKVLQIEKPYGSEWIKWKMIQTKINQGSKKTQNIPRQPLRGFHIMNMVPV